MAGEFGVNCCKFGACSNVGRQRQARRQVKLWRAAKDLARNVEEASGVLLRHRPAQLGGEVEACAVRGKPSVSHTALHNYSTPCDKKKSQALR